LIDHDHPSVLDHSEDQQKKHGRNDGKLNRRGGPSISSE